MNEQELAQFIEWLPSNISEFKNKTPDEVVTILNKLAQTEEGMNEISDLINQFKQKQIFKFGGKLGLNITKFQDGGKSGQRHSDFGIKKFHGVDLFKYGPNSNKTSTGYRYRSLKPGTHQEVLPNGVGLRQITKDNIINTELVSPDKRDTLYIHDGIGGRVDSNIDDSGFLGMLGLKQPTPVSNRFRELQTKFNAQKFGKGGKGEKVESRVVTNPTSWPTKTDSNGTMYYVMPADTVGSIVHRAVARNTGPGSEPGLVITEQVQTVGDPNDTYTKTVTRTSGNIETELRNGNSLLKNWGATQLPRGLFSRMLHRLSDEDKKVFELYDIKL